MKEQSERAKWKNEEVGNKGSERAKWKSEEVGNKRRNERVKK